MVVYAQRLDPALPQRVLLVDRDDDTRDLYTRYLTADVAEIEGAADGPEALAKAIAYRPDMIVMDTRLPRIDGFELCRLLRSDRITRATPIILLTAGGHGNGFDSARASGADAVLLKPCLPDVLLAEIRRVFLHSKEIREEELKRTVADRAPAAPPGRRRLSRVFDRHGTTDPLKIPPALVCPTCDQPLTHEHSQIGGVSERHREQWDYLQCPSGCGSFQYRQRTRSLRRV